MFRIVLRFKSQNVMLFYTWPFNPRPPLFKGGLCLPLPKIPKRLPVRNNPFEALRPPHKSIARKRAQAVKYRKNFVKVALRHQRGSFPLSRLRRSLKLRAPLLAELSAKAAFVQALAFGRKNCGAARREKLRTAMQTAHPHRKRANAPAFKHRFKTRHRTTPKVRTASARTTAARPVKILRNERFQDKKKYRHAL